MHVLWPALNGFLGFSSECETTDLLGASMVAEALTSILFQAAGVEPVRTAASN